MFIQRQDARRTAGEGAGAAVVGAAGVTEVDRGRGVRAEAAVLGKDVGPAEQLHGLGTAEEQALFQSDGRPVAALAVANVAIRMRKPAMIGQ